MKIHLEINLTPPLTTEEIQRFREKCQEAQVSPETKLAELIREEIKEEPETAAA